MSVVTALRLRGGGGARRLISVAYMCGVGNEAREEVRGGVRANLKVLKALLLPIHRRVVVVAGCL